MKTLQSNSLGDYAMGYIVACIVCVGLISHPTKLFALRQVLSSDGTRITISLDPGRYLISAVAGGWNAWGGAVDPPNKGGLAGTDAICHLGADDPGSIAPAGIYKAWLSDGVISPDNTFTKSPGQYSSSMAHRR